MKDRLDRRRHRRLPLQYEISCRRVSSPAGRSYSGHMVNVSSGGLYFKTSVDAFEQGDLLKVAVKIPPTAGLLEFGGKLAGYASVVRLESIRDNPTGDKCGVAVRFCRPPRLCL